MNLSVFMHMEHALVVVGRVPTGTVEFAMLLLASYDDFRPFFPFVPLSLAICTMLSKRAVAKSRPFHTSSPAPTPNPSAGLISDPPHSFSIPGR
jgi:hypothetical protein